jgi:hypothetical protein
MTTIQQSFRGFLGTSRSNGYIAFCVSAACGISSVLLQARHPVWYVLVSSLLAIMFTWIFPAISYRISSR